MELREGPPLLAVCSLKPRPGPYGLLSGDEVPGEFIHRHCTTRRRNFSSRSPWTGLPPSLPVLATGRDALGPSLPARPCFRIPPDAFALSSPFHFSHPDSPPYAERAMAGPSRKERAKERAKAPFGPHLKK